MKARRILLVHPLGYRSDKAGSDISRKANIMPPLGLASIAAYLDRHRIRSEIIDCYAHPNSDAMIRDHVKEKQPDFVGFSCTTATFLDGIRIARFVRQSHPRVKIVFGGVHVSALKEKLLDQYPEMDYIVVGEGEQTLVELIEADGDPCFAVKNTVYRSRDGKAVFTGYRKKMLDLDSLPFPAYDKLAGYPDAYKLPIFNYPHTPNTSCISSRGCPYSCSYCDRSVFRKSFRYNSAGYLYRHLAYLKDRFNIRHVNFYDDQFTFNRDRVVRFARMMIDNPMGMTFNCAARAEHLDIELLRLMKAAGCWMISLGIETGDEKLLARHRQNPDLNMLKEKIHLIKSAGIRVKGLLMMGLPGESRASIQRSKAYLFSLPVDDFNLAKFTPFPGSPVYRDIKEQGELLGRFEEDWEKMDCMQFLFIPKGLTRETLDRLFTGFYRSHFMRTKVLLGYVAMLWKSPDSWFRFLKDLSGFIRFAFTDKRM